MEDFRDPDTARRWSADPVSYNPTRLEQLDMLLTILKTEYREGTAILDVGFGSGLVEEMLFERIPGAEVVGVDGSPAMVELAAVRLATRKDQYTVVIHDLNSIASAVLPDHVYSAAISVQTIHNVGDEQKKATFKFIYDALEDGGLFLLMDRILVDTPDLFDVYVALWERLELQHGAHISSREGKTIEEHREILATRGDTPASLEEHLGWLREVGFEVALIHLHGNRALFAARKPEGAQP